MQISLSNPNDANKMETSSLETCANPGCDQPGTNKCGACKKTNYCGSKCQTADWAHHKEECPGHLHKIGMSHLEKAKGFENANNWIQALRHADLAATKLKQLKDRPVEAIDEALNCKYDSLGFMGRHREALECAKERYCLYLTSHTHPPAIEASFCLIESCVLNMEYFDAVLYARTLWETITLSRDSHIPDNLREQFTARGAFELGRATLALAQSGGIPVEELQEAGLEATVLARRAVKIAKQLYGAESSQVASDVGLLADLLDYFNDVDDDEVLRLHEQAKAIHTRVYGKLSPNVAANENNLGIAYERRAKRADAAGDLDRCVTNLELALSHLREAARIYRAVDHMEYSDKAARAAVKVEEWLQPIATIKSSQVTKG